MKQSGRTQVQALAAITIESIVSAVWAVCGSSVSEAPAVSEAVNDVVLRLIGVPVELARDGTSDSVLCNDANPSTTISKNNSHLPQTSISLQMAPENPCRRLAPFVPTAWVPTYLGRVARTLLRPRRCLTLALVKDEVGERGAAHRRKYKSAW